MVYSFYEVLVFVLNHRQERFCIEYAKGATATDAIVLAGYSKRHAGTSAGKLLNNPKIQKRLAELVSEYKTARIADIQEMQEKLTAIIRQEAEEEVIVQLFQGTYTEIQKVIKKPALKDVLQAISLLGKMQGAFNDRVTLDITPVVIRDDVIDAESC